MRRLTPDGKCSIDGCGRKHVSKTYCSTHLKRHQDGSDMNAPIKDPNPYRDVTCRFETCPNPAKSLGYCWPHYEQHRRNPNGVRELTPRPKFASIRERLESKIGGTNELGCWLVKKVGAQGYGVMSYQGKPDTLHRISYRVFKGEIPPGLEIDHQCRNRSCINPDHLKAVTRMENAQNRGVGPSNTSGYRGVCRMSGKTDKWRGYFTVAGKQFSKTGFDTAEEANDWVVAMRLRVLQNSVSDQPVTKNAVLG